MARARLYRLLGIPAFSSFTKRCARLEPIDEFPELSTYCAVRGLLMTATDTSMCVEAIGSGQSSGSP